MEPGLSYGPSAAVERLDRADEGAAVALFGLHQRLAGESLYSEMSRSAASSLSGADDVVLGGEQEPNHKLIHATEQLSVV